ncbi:unnamed protein product [Kuraishia capsulata CBS 1993]|uniref:PCI domain-containing protein n=1 Tax=Kuraishia capsulata CBS 1993 TaxID=1382522 RepID=W6MUA4_9ASCO|nr:uncharacterized protein KUCA_T00005034001 [Kuraishia capsulata CBS 1993]CDK29047.1 unnamed protein product [Kuraishia capsulata CBS 1993]
MSDYDDDDFMSGNSDGEEEFEFSFEEDEGDDDMMGDRLDQDQLGDVVDFENLYYSSKALKDDDLGQALESFKQILDGDAPALIVVKSLKQSMKIQYELGRYEQVIELLDQLVHKLDSVPSAYAEDSLKRILARYDKPLTHSSEQLSFLGGLYDRILEVGLNDVLATTTKLKKAGVLAEMNRTEEALAILLELENAYNASNKNYLEIIASEIKLLVENGSGDYARLRKLHNKFSNTNVDVLHPRIQGVVKECGGLLAMRSHAFPKANECFYDSFKCFDEAGDHRRLTILPKLLISTILSGSEINPFEAVEFQSFLKSGDIVSLLKIYHAILELDIFLFRRLMNDPEMLRIIEFDDFCLTYFPLVRENMNRRYVHKLLKAYSRLSLERLSCDLDISTPQVEQLLLRMFAQGELSNLKLDMLNGVAVRVTETSIVPANIPTEEVTSKLKALYNDDQEYAGDRKARSRFLMSAQREPLLGTGFRYKRRDDADWAVKEWVGTINSAVPIPKKTKLSQIEQIRLEKHMLQQKASLHLSASSTLDDSIPEILQQTTMNALNNMPLQDVEQDETGEEESKLMESFTKFTVQLRDHVKSLNQEISKEF